MVKSIKILFPVILFFIAGFMLYSFPEFLLNVEADAGQSGTSHKQFYVVNHGWHSGVVLKISDIPESHRSGYVHFIDKNFVEIGWGDLAFYQSAEFEYLTAARAVLWPTESVLHMVGFDQPVIEYFGLSGIVELKVNGDNFLNLLDFIRNHFSRDSLGQTISLGKGLYGFSQFYKSNKSYYFPKTCNVWTAQALKSAGYPIRPLYYQRAGRLMKYLEGKGKLINEVPKR